jgi:protein-S-isoprenylcysteine O-methyltransferase Ste14
MKILYKWRGFILGALTLGLLFTPGSTLSLMPGIIAATLLLVGIFLRVFARRSIGEHTRGSVHEAPELMTTGAYSLMRHPLYLSNTMIACAAIVFHLGFSWEAIPFAITLLLFECSLALGEDRFLKKLFGERWTLWASKTWAFLPNPAHFRATEKNRSLFQTLRADTSTWIWIILLALIL